MSVDHETFQRMLRGEYRKEEAMTTAHLPVTPDARISITVTEEYSNDDVASVTISTSGHAVATVAATATTKRDPCDKPDRSIGLTLAYGRALRKLGNDLVSQANRAVVEADKERRREQAKRAQVRSAQRKAEAQVEHDRNLQQIAKDLEARLRDQTKQIDDLAATLQVQSEQIHEYQRLDEQRKQRAIKQRVATRKANTAKKVAAKKVAPRKRAKA